MSICENQDYIKKHGIKKILDKKKQKWSYPKCGGIVTCPYDMCLFCVFEKIKNLKNLARNHNQ